MKRFESQFRVTRIGLLPIGIPTLFCKKLSKPIYFHGIHFWAKTTRNALF